MGPQGCHSSGLGQVIFFTSVRVNSTRTGTETMLLLSAVGSSDQVTMLGLGKLFQGHGCNPCKCLSLSQKQTAGLMEVWKSRGSGSWGRGWASSPQCTLGRRVSLPSHHLQETLPPCMNQTPTGQMFCAPPSPRKSGLNQPNSRSPHTSFSSL